MAHNGPQSGMTKDTAQARALDHTANCAAVPAGTRQKLARQAKGSQNKAPDKTRDPADGSGAKGGCG
eukprot:CAMPEP_0195270502 /NCGR_PEP_ID=MMETSP0706-20130129/14395_1 /TAXON_ID=33640 /ORGANISM="Asterionellopsis glacialis, Strain CCMP134" /LENGTH=66 /DNA_ID=CAMNT_0040325799 /DNA_START=168 /DNA_END=365 /DNA_ORIENTATION=+